MQSQYRLHGKDAHATHIERIDKLLTLYCHRCQEVHEDIGCQECHLEHRKNNSSQHILVIPDTEQTRLEVK